MTGIFEESVFIVSEIAANLFYPRDIEAGRYVGYVDTAHLQMHDGEHIERDESVPDQAGLQQEGHVRQRKWETLASRKSLLSPRFQFGRFFAPAGC